MCVCKCVCVSLCDCRIVVVNSPNATGNGAISTTNQNWGGCVPRFSWRPSPSVQPEAQIPNAINFNEDTIGSGNRLRNYWC